MPMKPALLDSIDFLKLERHEYEKEPEVSLGLVESTSFRLL